MRKVFKKEIGITLVALVITIIILLILAGITISQLTGSGLFENAKLAEEKSKNAQEKEDWILGDYENKIGEYVDSTREVTTNVLYPDYAKRETITFTDKSYTVQKDGYIQIRFAYATPLSVVTNDDVMINDIIVFVSNSDTNWDNGMSPLFLVKKGDVITYTNTAHNVEGYYYPFR